MLNPFGLSILGTPVCSNMSRHITKRTEPRKADYLNQFLEQRDKQDYDFENDSSIPEQVKKQTFEDRKRPGASLHQYRIQSERRRSQKSTTATHRTATILPN